MSVTTPLADKLRKRILDDGPITFRDWMAAALYDPEHGYYNASRSPWGRNGDYRTSPERTALFAATFAKYFVELYERIVDGDNWAIIESGGGAANFASEVLSWLSANAPELYQRITYVFDDRRVQPSESAMRLKKVHGDRFVIARVGDLATTHDGVVFANELLDAFPVHRITKVNGELLEYFVGVDQQGSFAWELRQPSTPKLETYIKEQGIVLAEQQSIEVNLDVARYLNLVNQKLGRGFIVLVDYGAAATALYSANRLGGTLRSFRNHVLEENVLRNPGEQDITSTVNWTYVRSVSTALGLCESDFARLDEFFLRHGILEELEARRKTNDAAELMRLRVEAREMVLPSGMAGSFQVLVLEKKPLK